MGGDHFYMCTDNISLENIEKELGVSMSID